MRSSSTLLTTATLASLLLVSAAPAANTTWIFKFGASTFSLGNDTPVGIVGGLALDPPRNSFATYASPDGTSGFVGNDSAEGVSESFANVAQFEALEGNPAAPWSLAQGSSHYTFSPDFSSVDPASVPIVTLNSPLAASTTANPPTLHWTTTGTTPLTLIQVSDANFNVDEQFVLPGDFSSFTLPAPLPAGTYSVFISVSSLAVTIPIHTTLVSGPDLAITPEGSFQFADEALSTFTVNPALLGDANTDGTVDLNDLNIVMNHLGQTTSNWTDGNFDNAPTIDLTDLNDVLNNLGTTATSSAIAAPEPGSLALLVTGTTLLLTRAHSKRSH
jgi:hypothetical protein